MPTAPQIQQAVQDLYEDSAKLHQIIHGDADTVVSTEGGPVKSVANLQREFELDSAEVVAQTEEDAAAAAASAQLAADWAEKSTEPGGAGTKSAKTWATESASSAVAAGAVDLFPDNFFAHSAARGEPLVLAGRNYLAASAGDTKVWDATYAHAFGNGAYRIPAGTNPGRFRVWFDSPMAVQEGVTTGSILRACAFLAGTNGATVQIAGRFIDSSGAFVGAQTVNAVVTLGSAARAFQGASTANPAGTAGLEIWLWCPTADLYVIDVGCAVGSDATALIRNKWRGFADARTGATLRETEAALQDADTRLETWLDAISNEIDTVTVGTRTDSIVMEVGGGTDRPEESGMFTGWGQTFDTPGTFTSNAMLIGGIRRGATTKKWERIEITLRTHATDPANPAATVVAKGELLVDPDTAPLGELVIPWRDKDSGALKTVTQADLLAKYGIFYQAWVDGSVKATAGEVFATTLTGVTRNLSYYVTSADAETGTWLPASGNPVLALAAVNYASINQEFVYKVPQSAIDQVPTTPTVGPLHYADVARLRRLKIFAQMRRRPTPAAVRHIHGQIGDSWTSTRNYGIEHFARDMAGTLGDGGVGFIGFGILSGGLMLEARGLWFLDGALTNWTSNYGSNTVSPNLSDIRSSTAGAAFKIGNTTGATYPAIAAAKLHFTGTADGVIRYRWYVANVAQAWQANLNVQGTVGAQQVVDLVGFPTNALSAAAGRAHCLEIEVVSGSVILCGVDLQSAANGIVVHKLGASGSALSGWLAPNATQQAAGWQALGLQSVEIMLGTNDQAGGVGAATYATRLGQLIDRVRAALPTADIWVTIPPENASGRTIKMKDYAAAAIAVCASRRVAYLNLQPAFGDPDNAAADYGPSGTFPMFINSDHPDDDALGSSGAAAIAEQKKLMVLSR